MDAAEILDQLTHAEGLPKTALQAASAQRAEMVPVFLRESILIWRSTRRIGRSRRRCSSSSICLANGGRKPPTGRWRRLLRCPAHEIDAILGDGHHDHHPPRHGSSLRWRSAAALRDHPRPACRASSSGPACAKRSPCWCCGANSTGAWSPDFSATPSWSCSRKPNATSGKAGNPPSRCSGWPN